MAKKTENMTDEELAERAAYLADEKKKIKNEENEIRAHQELRTALANASDSTRRLIKINIGGDMAPEGEAKGAQA